MPALNPNDFARLVTIPAPDVVTALTFSPDGSILAIATGDKVHLFQVPAAARSASSAASSASSSATRE